jgi:hypothetical protein
VTNNIDPAESASAGERGRAHAPQSERYRRSEHDGAFGVAAARTGRSTGRDVPGAEARAP